MENSVTRLFDISYPIIQGGMVWCSGWRLVSAVSEAGGLGLIGAGSMYPEVLREHIRKAQSATQKPFGVNVPLLYPEIEKLINVLIEEKVKIVFTSAGNPASWTPLLKDRGITVVHVVSSSRFAKKAEDAGVDAVVAEGFEAGGHNGREETTSFCLIPMVRSAVNIPVIAAGGMYGGKSLMAAIALGADGIQVGSRFAASVESSAHLNFKQTIIGLGEGGTQLSLKKVVPVRLVKNAFFNRVEEAESRGASKEELISLLGKRRAKAGIFEGDLEEGELEIGQVSSQIIKIETAEEIVNSIWSEFVSQWNKMKDLNL